MAHAGQHCRFLPQQEDLWDFGTVRNVHARPGGPATLRRQREQQQHADARAFPQPPTTHPRQPSAVPSQDYRSRDYAMPPPSQNHAAFDTVRRGPPPVPSPARSTDTGPSGISAHSEYDEYSSAGGRAAPASQVAAGSGGSSSKERELQARARDALERERAKLEAMRLDDMRKHHNGEAEVRAARLAREREEAMGTAASGQSGQIGKADPEQEDDDGILGSVVLPVLDSVSASAVGGRASPRSSTAKGC